VDPVSARGTGPSRRDAGDRPAEAGRAPVSVVIAAKDEEARIAGCVASVAGWAGEVLVVECGSTDDTVLVARSEGATVFTHPFETIGKQRNAAIARAAHEWVLVLDADERCTPELAREVADVVGGGPRHDAYRVPRRNFFLGREIRHGGWASDRPVRLFRRELRYDDRPVHEHVVTRGAVGTLGAALLHYPYSSLAQYFEKLDRYSRWWAAQHYARGRRASALAVAVKPPARFVSMYLLRGGFLDGAAGAVLATLAAASVAAKYARLWELTLRQERATLGE
jgi:glycosyltransferase involved in cell wall biosynthesis